MEKNKKIGNQKYTKTGNKIRNENLDFFFL